MLALRRKQDIAGEGGSYTFFARGREHTEAEVIHAVLDELTSLLKNSGYLPDTSELYFA